MGRTFLTVVLGLLFCCTALAQERQKSIFDDDWHSVTEEQRPAPPITPTPPVTPVTPATPSETPMPAPVVPTPIPTPPISRIAVPTATAQADAWKLIKEELYKDDIANAKTPPQKVELAKKLLAVAGDTNKDMTGKYVLLAQAKDIAISSGDPPTAFQCLDEMGRAFDINYPHMKMNLFTALSTTVTTPADCKTVAEGLNHWADGQVKADRYDTAKSAIQLAMTVARKSGDAELIKTTGIHQTQIAEIEAACLATKFARATLSKKPNDPGANLALGRFYCFMKGDWDKGLPMLALGSDAGLKTLAQKETAGVSGAEAQMALGDSWWNLIEKEGLAQDRVRGHAAKWYRQALPGLEGLAKAKAEKRAGQVRLDVVEGSRQEQWLSKGATYTVSSFRSFEGKSLSPLPALLTGEGTLHQPFVGDRFAFQTKDEAGAYIKIDLGRVDTITQIKVTNREIPANYEWYDKAFHCAVGMKVWLSDDPQKKGKEIWTCTSAEAEWTIRADSVKARYITIGFPDDVVGTLHLKYVKVYGYE